MNLSLHLLSYLQNAHGKSIVSYPWGQGRIQCMRSTHSAGPCASADGHEGDQPGAVCALTLRRTRVNQTDACHPPSHQL